MSISVPSIRWDDRRREEWSTLVRKGATILSQRLGHRPRTDSEPATAR
jgi:DNA-binding IclR family transcriptional regulator